MEFFKSVQVILSMTAKKKLEKQKTKAQKAKHKTANLSSDISLVTLNIKGLNTPIKRQDWQSG